MPDQEQLYDITIIGGGPTGLFAAFYAGMRQMKVKIIESLPQLGGQLSVLYPEKYIYDIAGYPKVKAKTLVDNLIEQAMQFEPTVVLGKTVEHVEKQADDTFKLVMHDKEEHFSKTVLITAGVGAFKPRPLQVPGAERYENSNLHYYVKDMNEFKDKKVVICGGGDSAVDWALMLEPIAKEVIIVHRRDQFRAHEFSVEQMLKTSVNVKTPFEVVKLIGDEHVIHSVVIQEVKGEKRETIDVDDVIVSYGFVSNLGPIKNWGLDIERNAIVVNTKMETNIKGIYAAGDIATYEGKIKLIATGFGEAPTAVNNAKAYIDPKAKLQPQHSTSLMDNK